MTKMPEELNAGFGLPQPSIHAAAHYSEFLTRYAQKQVEPAEAKALSDAAILIEILGQEVRRLHQELVEDQALVEAVREDGVGWKHCNPNIAVIEAAMTALGRAHPLFPLLDHAAAELAVLTLRNQRAAVPEKKA